MPEEACVERPLYGGAISMTFPLRFQDLSNVRQIPDHQEAYADPGRDESVIIELLDLKQDVTDESSAVWFLQDLAREQDAENGMLIEQSGVVEAPALRYRNVPAVVTSAIGQMLIKALSMCRYGSFSPQFCPGSFSPFFFSSLFTWKGCKYSLHPKIKAPNGVLDMETLSQMLVVLLPGF